MLCWPLPSLQTTLAVQGVISEVREEQVIRSVREDSESSCVGEIAFFMGIAQPRTFQVCAQPGFMNLSITSAVCSKDCQPFGSFHSQSIASSSLDTLSLAAAQRMPGALM